MVVVVEDVAEVVVGLILVTLLAMVLEILFAFIILLGIVGDIIAIEVV